MKKKIFNSIIKQFYLPTQDNWAPNYPRDTVLITFYCFDNKNSVKIKDKNIINFMISIWGQDDTGMCLEFLALSKEKDYWINSILKELDKFPNPLNMDWLLNNGFQYI